MLAVVKESPGLTALTGKGEGTMQAIRRTPLIVILSVLLFVVAACAAPPPPVAVDILSPAAIAAKEAANVAIVRSFYEEYAAGHPEVILEIHPETIRMHYQGQADDVPTQALYEDLAAIKASNPDLHAEIFSIIGMGDYVFTELAWAGTHTGEIFGIAPTGNPYFHPGIVVRRLENGLVVESWEVWDDLTLMNGLGFTPSWDEIVDGQ